jgi:hypothetical protein
MQVTGAMGTDRASVRHFQPSEVQSPGKLTRQGIRTDNPGAPTRQVDIRTIGTVIQDVTDFS